MPISRKMASITKVVELLGMSRMPFILGWLIMLCAAAMPLRIQAATFLQVEVANFVFYVDDGSGQTSWATQVQATPGTLGRAFATFVGHLRHCVDQWEAGPWYVRSASTNHQCV